MNMEWKRRIQHILDHLTLFLFSKSLSPPNLPEEKMINELRTAVRELKQGRERTNSPSFLEPWADNTIRLANLILDPNNDPREFLLWDVIQDTMFVGNALSPCVELHFLKSLPDWQSRWSEAIKESKVGQPIPFWRHPRSSGNLIHHAYHLAKFESKTGIRINNFNKIIEFGGGYGSMCRLCFNLRFEGKYIIHDLPIFSALQEFFLKSIGLNVYNTVDLFETARQGVLCTSDLENIQTTPFHSNAIDHCMFIATWSLSEVPLKLRYSVLNQVSGCQSFLIGYQDSFENIDNISFFRDFKFKEFKINPSMIYYNWQIKHMPRNYYMYLVK